MATNDKNYGPNFQFKGQVKIEDVSRQLDLLVDGINNMIDTYNDAGYVTDIDLNDVSSELSPMDYTLSVGGLKKVLDAYDNAVIGCNVFTDSKKENLYISSGLLLTRNGGYGLPSAVIKNEGQTEIWYSPSKNQYVGSSAVVKEESTFTFPKFTSSETWGKLDVTLSTSFKGESSIGTGVASQLKNPNNIWDCLNGGQTSIMMAFNGIANRGHTVSNIVEKYKWTNFPKTVYATKLTFDSNNNWHDDKLFEGCDITVEAGSYKSTQRFSERTWRSFTFDFGGQIPVNSVIITFAFDTPRKAADFWFLYNYIRNLVLHCTTVNTKPAGGGITGADDLVKVATLNHNTNKNYLNVTDFRLAPENMRIAAKTNINKYWTSSDTVDNQSADRYIAFLPQQSDSDIALYSKLFLPTGCSYTAWGSYPKVAKSRQMYL